MLAENLITSLIKLGVETVISCPGGRSAAILNAILKSKKFNVETFYDERSAGFYALGKSIKSEKPVVVLTTSGSAVASLYPAVLESKYQERGKLILITADRPKEYAGTGAPQTIKQEGFFKSNDVETMSFQKSFNLDSLTYPLHINVHLEDPAKENNSNQTETKNNSPLIIVSSLTTDERAEVMRFLKNYSGALVLESLSNLSEQDFPNAKVIKYPEQFLLQEGLNSFSAIYRVGGVPVLKSWRSTDSHEAVFFWNRYSYPGAVHAKGISLEEVAKNTTDLDCLGVLTEKIEQHHKRVQGVVLKHPESEVANLIQLSEMISGGAQAFIGNSMPIREWEFVNWTKHTNIGQRGVNGIDGSLALALGSLDKERENWIVVGDLTLLYNINDFQALKGLKNYTIRIVVINNCGGRIFDKIFTENVEHFVNEQSCSFKDLANFWKINYTIFSNDFKIENLSKHSLIEIQADPKKSRLFWNELG